MLKRMIGYVTLLMLILFIRLDVSAAETTDSPKLLLEDFVEIEHSYANNKEPETNGIIFNIGTLFSDATTFSPEMAKTSVALSVAAYDQANINALLSQMGFSVEDNTASYTKEANLTLNDNDYAAYTIATYENENYIIYCVPVKGTDQNAAWYSNFNLGTPEEGEDASAYEHKGFRLAAEIVYNDLVKHFENDSAAGTTSQKKRVVWLTGHSRGAAVANLVAGWLTENEQYAAAENIFGYTFACPNVGKAADTTLTNIYNFNNKGDLIPLLPLSTWGYKRYGKEIILKLEQYDNVAAQFKTITGDYFHSHTTNEHFLNIINKLVKTEEDFNSEGAQLAFTVLGYCLGGSQGTSVQDVILKVLNEKYAGAISEYIPSGDLTASNVKKMFENLQKKFTDWQGIIEEGKQLSIDYGTEHADYIKFCEDNAAVINEIEEYFDVEDYLSSYADVKGGVIGIIDTTLTAAALFQELLGIVYDDGQVVGDPIAVIMDGHTQTTYVAWINSMYLGYQGWLNYNGENLPSTTLERPYSSIGAKCFSGCNGVASISLSDDAWYVGTKAFYNCLNVNKITVPIDHRYGEHAYAQCDADEIHFLKGPTGIMPDLSIDDNAHNSYKKSLQYGSRGMSVLTFADGIANIGNYAFYNAVPEVGGPVSITLPESVTSIGDYAFHYQSKLCDINLPSALESIGRYSFFGCSKLTGFNLPLKITAIPEGCYGFCTSLSEIVIPDRITTIGNGAFSNCTGIKTVTLPIDCNYSKETFMLVRAETINYTYGQSGIMKDHTESNHATTLEGQSTTVSKITFDDKITRIGNYAFYCSVEGQGGLKTVKLPASLESIGDYAFKYQKNITELVFPNNLNSLGKQGFYGCKGLTKLSFPEMLTTIPEYCFAYCTGLKEIVIPDSVTKIQSGAFSNCGDNDNGGITSITIPVDYNYTTKAFINVRAQQINYTFGSNGVMIDRTNFSSYDSYYHNSLEYQSRSLLNKITFEEGITRIGNYAFYSTGVTNVQLPSTLESIGECGFYGQSKLQQLDLPDNLSSLGKYCFQNSGLTSIKIPVGISTIPEKCFYGCKSLKSLELKDTVTTLEYGCFGNCTGLETVTLPAEYNFKNNPFEGTTAVKTIHYKKGISGKLPERSNAPSKENYLQNSLEYISRDSLSSITFEEGITYIGDYAFYYDANESGTTLVNVTFPSTLEVIRDYAFYNQSGITKLEFPNNLNTLRYNAFRGCKGIKELVIPGNVKVIDRECFYGCDTLETLHLLNGCEEIGKYSFGYCKNLKKVILPSSLTSINDYAFSNCSAIESVIYCGDETEWEAISKGTSGNGAVLNADYRSYHSWGEDDCIICGKIKPVSHVHDYSYSVSVTPAECTKEGYTTHTCSCGEYYIDSKVSVLGHSYDDGVTTLNPTETSEGIVTFTCKTCGDIKQEVIPMLKNPFVDVNASDYFYDAVLWAVENGITSGTSATTFSPNDSCIRAQIVTFLWRDAGSPEPLSDNNPFIDVYPSDYYYKAVLWAVENGITSGTSATTFSPNDSCTRAQVVTFLWRKNGSPEQSTGEAFLDTPSNAYYYDAVKWAVNSGITYGIGNGLFGSDNPCTRGQVVTFLYRSYQ